MEHVEKKNTLSKRKVPCAPKMEGTIIHYQGKQFNQTTFSLSQIDTVGRIISSINIMFRKI